MRALLGGALTVALPDETQACEREEGVDAVDRPGVRGDQIGEPPGRDGLRLGPELAANVFDDPVHLTREAVHEARVQARDGRLADHRLRFDEVDPAQDRKSTRLNSSHVAISYAVFCLKKKKKHI